MLLPTHRSSEAGFGFTFAVASRFRSTLPARSQYVAVMPLGALTMPSLAFKSAAGTPSFAAAAARRMSRASAQANRRAVPLCSTERLPAVCPSFGVCAVSPLTTWMRSRLTSSSSAAICESAVPMPCPSSILPVKIVTVPFGSMRSHASSIRFALRLPGNGTGVPCASATCGASANPMTSAPLDLMKWRRDTSRAALMTASPWRRVARRGRCDYARRIDRDGRSAPA